MDFKLFRKYTIFCFSFYKLLLHTYFTQWHHAAAAPARMVVNVLLLVDITSVFVLVDLMVENVKVTKAQMWLFHDEVVHFCLCYKSITLCCRYDLSLESLGIINCCKLAVWMYYKGYLKSVNQRKTNNTMAKRTITNKILHSEYETSIHLNYSINIIKQKGYYSFMDDKNPVAFR